MGRRRFDSRAEGAKRVSTYWKLACIDCRVSGTVSAYRSAEPLEIIWRHRRALWELGDHVRYTYGGDGGLHGLYPEHDGHDVRAITEYGDTDKPCARCGHDGYAHGATGERDVDALLRGGCCNGKVYSEEARAWITQGPCDCTEFALPPKPAPRTREEIMPEITRALHIAFPDRADEVLRALELLLVR